MPDTAPASHRLARTLGQLALALLNATLILVVLALFLAWRLSGTVERVTEAAAGAAAQQLAELAPVGDELSGLREQVAGLRLELAAMQADGEAGARAAADAVATRLDEIETRLEDTRARIGPAIEALSADPGILVDRAVEAGVAEAGRWLVTLRGCTPPPET
jgi:hypothetical protein